MISSEIPGMYPLNKGSWMTTFLSIILDLTTQLTESNAYCILQKRKRNLTLWPEMQYCHVMAFSLKWLKWLMLCLQQNVKYEATKSQKSVKQII